MHKKIDEILELIYKGIEKNFQRAKYERTLYLIKTYAKIMYLYNQTYVNEKIEELLYKITNLVYSKPNILKKDLNEKTILFYDGFGLEKRGLIQIYLRALCKKYHVVYVTDISNEEKIPTIIELIKNNNGEIYYIDNNRIIKGAKELITIVEKIKPKNMFLYTYPDDVTAIVAFENFENVICRYQINLTDHAFWLGTKAFDYCIEFRNYGASITNKHRNIETKKIVKLPFYPDINYSQEFLGYPNKNQDMENKFIFSGGALYKTFGDNMKYYRVIEELLLKYQELYFWYAGNGDNTEIKKLISKYPQRVFYTEERKDFYQIIERCYFYLSTYPICGGLMFQYAARAKKIPITLKHDEITDEFLLNQEKLNIIFESDTEMYLEIEKIHSDEEYRSQRENEISNSVISEKEFEENLYKLIEKQKNEFCIEYKDLDIEKFRKIYRNNIKVSDIYKIFFENNKLSLLLQFPFITLYGLLIKIILKIKNMIYKNK